MTATAQAKATIPTTAPMIVATSQTVYPSPIQGINWPQTAVDGGVAFVATLLAFGLALWQDRRKRTNAEREERQKEAQSRAEQFQQEMKETERKRSEEEEDRKARTQILVEGLLRELKRAFELFRSDTSSLKYPRAQNLYETYILETTTKEQLELLRNKEVLDKLAQIRPNIMAFKHYYLDALKYHRHIDHFQNKVMPEFNVFEEAVSQMQTLLNNSKVETKEFCTMLKKLAPFEISTELDAEKWN